MAGVVGLSHPAAFAMAEALGVPAPVLAELFPEVERAALAALRRSAPDPELQEENE